MEFHPDVQMSFFIIYSVFCKTKMSNCQNGGLVSAKTLEFLIAALFKTLFSFRKCCFCAVRKIVIIPFHPSWAGLWKASAERKQVLSTSRHANSSSSDYLFTIANTIGSNDFIGNL
jgi:hypothetical protein